MNTAIQNPLNTKLVNGWTLLVHDCLKVQVQKLQKTVEKSIKHSGTISSNSNVKLLQAITTLMLEIIPADPSHEKFRQGNTLGREYSHWRRAKIGRRFRLFFRYDSSSKIIIYAWINDNTTLRSAGSDSDPYKVFQKMLKRGNPPNNWQDLLEETK